MKSSQNHRSAIVALALVLTLVVFTGMGRAGEVHSSSALAGAILFLDDTPLSVCVMVDKGEGKSAWVDCMNYRKPWQHVKLTVQGKVSRKGRARTPMGIGGPGNAIGTWKIVGRFRCELLTHGVECVVISTGKGFRIQGRKVTVLSPTEQISAAGRVPEPALGKNLILYPWGSVFAKAPGKSYSPPAYDLVRAPVGTVVDASRGGVKITAATGAGTETRSGSFWHTSFRVGQVVNPNDPDYGAVTLTLTQPRGRACAAKDAAQLSWRARLWGESGDGFQVRGFYVKTSGGSGSKWFVENRCRSTFVKAVAGQVQATGDRTITLDAGQEAIFRKPAEAGTSHALLWKALDGKVTCGVAGHLRSEPASQVLCMARVIPRPTRPSPEGDPGFVFLAGHGRARRAKLSEYSWQAPARAPKFTVNLKVGQRWRYKKIGVTCKATESSVRCANRAGHGFAITKDSYRGF